MSDPAKPLLSRYVAWLLENSTESPLDAGHAVLDLPFLDHHNDQLRIYVKPETGGGYSITDDGEIMRDLSMQYGISFRDTTIHNLQAEAVLRGLGFEDIPIEAILFSGEIRATATDRDLPEKLHAVIMAMIEINSLYRIDTEDEGDEPS